VVAAKLGFVQERRQALQVVAADIEQVRGAKRSSVTSVLDDFRGRHRQQLQQSHKINKGLRHLQG
jgi:hypothetical protein